MKQTYVVILLLGVTLMSCRKKNYTCKCDGGLTGKGMEMEIKQARENAARKACKKNESDATVDGFTNCRLL